MQLKHVLLLLFAFYYFMGLWGYGIDEDVYGILNSGLNIWTKFEYSPSRFQGSLVTEVIIGALALSGGYYLTNFVSALLSIGTLLLIYRLIGNLFSPKEKTALILAVGLNPFYVVASSTSMDYIYSLFFLVMAIYLIEKKQLYLLAGIAFAFTVSARISNALLVAVSYIYFFLASLKYPEKYNIRKIMLSGLISSILVAGLFLPVFIHSGYNFDFLSHAAGDWNLYERFARLCYKNFYLFGFFPSLFLLGTFLHALFTAKRPVRGFWLAGICCAILTQEIFFFFVPVEKSYLIPIVPAVILVWYLFVRKYWMLITLALLTAVSNFFEIDILKMHYKIDRYSECYWETVAIGAEFGFFPKQGYTIEVLLKKRESQEFFLKCNPALKRLAPSSLLENSKPLIFDPTMLAFSRS